MNQTIWLTGSRGFIGGYLLKELESAGHEVNCFTNQRSFEEDVICLNYNDREQINLAVKKYGVPNTFVHLGWGNVYLPHHSDHISTNLQSGKNLINELYESGLERFILIGSSSEYGEKVGKLSEVVCNPDESINKYVKGKIILSNYGLEVAKKFNKSFIHVRLFYTYGAGQKHNSLINQIHKSYLSGESINLSPCLQYRDYIHAYDASIGIKKLCYSDYRGIVNLGTGKIIQLKSFIEKLWNEYGQPREKLKFGQHSQPDYEQVQPKAYADLKQIIKLTNWQPSIDINKGIKITVSNLLEKQI